MRRYLNGKGVPQLFIASSADKWADRAHYPWTIGFNPSYRIESAIYGRYILQTRGPNARIGVLYQNDDFGKDYLIGLKQALGQRYGRMVVKEVSYEVTDPTIDSQVVTLQSAGVDVLITASIPKFAAQTIRKLAEVDWKPLHIVTNVSAAIASVLVPAGLENAVGLISTAVYKSNSDPRWANDPGMNEWRGFINVYLPRADRTDHTYVWPYAFGLTLVQVLKQCGNDLSRASIMRQATNLHALELPTLPPGIAVNTSPTNYRPIRSLLMQRFNGKSWEVFGAVISS